MKTIVETNTGKLLFSTDNDNYICLENQSKIDIHLTEMFVSPFFDFLNNSYYEGATSEEIAEANKPIVPQTISAMRLKLQLFDMGITDEDIFEDIDSIPEVMFSTVDKEKAKIMYKTATSFERTDGKLNLIATMEGLTQEQVDEIFINGNLLR